MNFVLLILSGVIMGLIAAVPIGPVNLICIRRSFAFGPVNGFVSGLGAALGDGVFAAITCFGLTWIAQLIESYDAIIELDRRRDAGLVRHPRLSVAGGGQSGGSGTRTIPAPRPWCGPSPRPSCSPSPIPPP